MLIPNSPLLRTVIAFTLLSCRGDGEGCSSSDSVIHSDDSQTLEDLDGDGYSVQLGDCNDDDETIFPGAPEVSCNGIDENCDGTADNVIEICNGFDDDCDDLVDEGIVATLLSTTGETIANYDPNLFPNSEAVSITEDGNLMVCGETHMRFSIDSSINIMPAVIGVPASIVADNQGSAVVVKPGASVTIEDIIISDGMASSDISTTGDCSYRDGLSAAGGGICCKEAQLTVTNSIIINNYSDALGGGLFAENCDLQIIGTTFSDNQALESGGGIAVVNDFAHEFNLIASDVRPSLVSNNISDDYGGGVFVSHSSETLYDSYLIEDSWIQDNSSYLGGGLALLGGVSFNCSVSGLSGGFAGNIAHDSGGGVWIDAEYSLDFVLSSDGCSWGTDVDTNNFYVDVDGVDSEYVSDIESGVLTGEKIPPDFGDSEFFQCTYASCEFDK